MSDPKPKTIIEIKSLAGAVLFRWEGYSQRSRRAALEEATGSGADLSDADLSDADLSGADLSDADLSDADLSGADLSDADLRDADLSDADLSGADLSGADLSGAVLSGADLSDADLSDADLSGADLDPVRDDLYNVLAAAPAEVPALLAALREGRVDGSTYEGSCSCLVGTIATARGVRYDQLAVRPNADRPAERWFLGISEGDTPETSQISAITASWVEDWLAKQTAPVAKVEG